MGTRRELCKHSKQSQEKDRNDPTYVAVTQRENQQCGTPSTYDTWFLHDVLSAAASTAISEVRPTIF